MNRKGMSNCFLLGVLASLAGLAGCQSTTASTEAERARSGTVEEGRGPNDAVVEEIISNAEPIDLSGFEEPFDVYASFEAGDADVKGTDLRTRGPVLDVMGVKLQDAINTLADPAAEEQIHRAAVDQIMESLFISNLVVLPTQGVPEADPLDATHDQMMQDAINALNQHIDPIAPGTGNSKEDAWDARNFLQLMQEALEVVGQQTSQCDPANLRSPGCALLIEGDEGGVDVDKVFPSFSRSVRSPFFVGQGTAQIEEQVIVPDVIAPDECVIILKEIQGIKAVVRRVQIPIWVEPWFARATIVGFRTVWVWEFIPAEFLKTISYCNSAGTVKQEIDIVVVLERELTHFWAFMDKITQIGP